MFKFKRIKKGLRAYKRFKNQAGKAMGLVGGAERTITHVRPPHPPRPRLFRRHQRQGIRPGPHYDSSFDYAPPPAHQRQSIPGSVKRAVWQRDGGRCVKCGSTEELQFDHIIPVAKGGSSKTPGNIQLLCGVHNREKRTRIE